MGFRLLFENSSHNETTRGPHHSLAFPPPSFGCKSKNNSNQSTKAPPPSWSCKHARSNHHTQLAKMTYFSLSEILDLTGDTIRQGSFFFAREGFKQSPSPIVDDRTPFSPRCRIQLTTTRNWVSIASIQAAPRTSFPRWYRSAATHTPHPGRGRRYFPNTNSREP